MAAVHIRVPTIIDDLLRYPAENPITVSDDTAKSLKERKLLEEDKAPAKKEA